CLLMALSALTTLGTLYQLLAQVPGLALLAACAVFYLRPLDEIGRQPALRHGTLLAVLAAGLMLVYPAVIPFLGLAFLVGLAANRAQWRGLAWRPLLAVFGVATLGVLLLVNYYFPATLNFLLCQALHGSSGSVVLSELFPYYLLPTGLPNVWG